jgi:hypothetical protein
LPIARFLFYFFQETDIGKIYPFKPPEIKQVDDDRDRDNRNGGQECWEEKLHSILER